MTPEIETKPRTMSEAFDEWMRRYEEEPERFTREFQDVQRFIEEGGREGKPTSYGMITRQGARCTIAHGGNEGRRTLHVVCYCKGCRSSIDFMEQ